MTDNEKIKAIRNAIILKKYITDSSNFKNLSFKDWNYRVIRKKEEYYKFKTEYESDIEVFAKLNNHFKELDGNIACLEGYCACCDKITNHIISASLNFSTDLMYTETFTCNNCKLNNRLRAMFHIFKLFENNPNDLKIYMYEYNTNFYKQFFSKYGDRNTIIGSEYFGYNVKPGEFVNGTRNENALNLSFDDDSLDYIISNDVFEHVPDIDKALSEAHRCLKKGGRALIHVPFMPSLDKSLVRAKITDGEIEYLMPKEYHGGFSATDKNGCLAFYTFGWDLLDKIKDAGFEDCYTIVASDTRFLNFGLDPMITIIAVK